MNLPKRMMRCFARQLVTSTRMRRFYRLRKSHFRWHLLMEATLFKQFKKVRSISSPVFILFVFWFNSNGSRIRFVKSHQPGHHFCIFAALLFCRCCVNVNPEFHFWKGRVWKVVVLIEIHMKMNINIYRKAL